MPHPSRLDMSNASEYPHNWDKVADRVKERAGWRCVRCGHPAEGVNERIPCDDQCDPDRHPGGLDDGRQRILTVHHLDEDKSNCRWWNLAALCQVCHLVIQGKVDMERCWPFPHSEWFRPYVAGYYAHHFGLPDEREIVTDHTDELILLGQGRLRTEDVEDSISAQLKATRYS